MNTQDHELTEPLLEKTAQNYTQLCDLWSRCDYWPLEDAVRLLLSVPPRLFGPNDAAENKKAEIRITYEIAVNCLGESLPAFDRAAFPEKYPVRPADFLAWAYLKGLQVPVELSKAVEAHHGKLPTSEKPERALTPVQRHRERCRGIASLLWQQTPDVTIAAMAQRPELQAHGCEEKKYGQRTVENWIRDLCPSVKVGRPSTKNTSSTP